MWLRGNFTLSANCMTNKPTVPQCHKMEILILPYQKLKPVTPLLRLQYPSLPLPIAGTRSLKWRNKARICSISCTHDVDEKPADVWFERRAFFTFLVAGAALFNSDMMAGAVSKRALRGAKIPETEYTTLPNGLKYYDLKVGSGPVAVKGSRVAIHYVAKWRNLTFMTSRQGLGVGGGMPYGFDVGDSKRGTVLKGLDLGVEGMRVGGQRLLIVPPELAYGSKGVQEIPPNATIEFDVELLSIKQTPFGSPVKIVEG